MSLGQVPPNGWNLNGMFFDSWLELNHDTSLTITHHPVETGAAITDHSFMNPRQFSFKIGKTDVAVEFSKSGSRSVEAYRELCALQASRQLCTLTTKYGTFPNILIESTGVFDDYRTQNALFATINLEQITIASTTIATAVSSLPQTTDSTNRGQVSPQAVPDTVQGLLNEIFNKDIPAILAP